LQGVASIDVLSTDEAVSAYEFMLTKTNASNANIRKAQM